MPHDDLSDPVRALLVDAHHVIAEAASIAVDDLAERRIATHYPPEDVLTEAEIAALEGLALSADARSGLEKCVADACARAVRDVLARIDADGGAALAAARRTRLQDAFFDTWWLARDRP